jgi:hypothetical protein
VFQENCSWVVGFALLQVDPVRCILVTMPVAQCSETNVMHILFILLRIMGLYIFRALLAHPQEATHKRHLVYCVRVISVGCYEAWCGTGVSDPSFQCRLCSAS